eukprot:COSAG01_NODE_14169_length_1488_cov_0.786177_1_plen_152_part_00
MELFPSAPFLPMAEPLVLAQGVKGDKGWTRETAGQEVGFEPAAGEWTAAKWWKKFSEVKTSFAIAIANWTKSGSETDAPFKDFIPNAATKNEKIMCRVWFYLFKGRPDILPLFHRSVPAATGFDTATSGVVQPAAAASGKRGYVARSEPAP